MVEPLTVGFGNWLLMRAGFVGCIFTILAPDALISGNLKVRLWSNRSEGSKAKLLSADCVSVQLFKNSQSDPPLLVHSDHSHAQTLQVCFPPRIKILFVELRLIPPSAV
ncbi:hypothetical protein LguiB_025008 [Lonicera macranthoides]